MYATYSANYFKMHTYAHASTHTHTEPSSLPFAERSRLFSRFASTPKLKKTTRTVREKVSFRTVGNLVKFFKDGNNNASHPTTKSCKRNSFALEDADQSKLDTKLTRKIGQVRSIFQDSNATVFAAQTITTTADDIELMLNNDSGKENYDSADDGNSNSFNITNISAVPRDDSPTIMSLTMSKTFESPIDSDDLYGSAYSRSRSKSFVRTHQQNNNEPYSHWIENKRKSIQKSKSFAAPSSVIKQFDDKLRTPTIIEPIGSVIVKMDAPKRNKEPFKIDTLLESSKSTDYRRPNFIVENKFEKYFGCPAKDSQSCAHVKCDEKTAPNHATGKVKKIRDLSHLKFNSENVEVAPKLSPSLSRSSSNRSQKSSIDSRYTKYFGFFANEPLSPVSDGQSMCLASPGSTTNVRRSTIDVFDYGFTFSRRELDEADNAFDELYNSFKITEEKLQQAEKAFEISYLGAVKIQLFVSFFFFFDKKKLVERRTLGVV